MKKAKELPIFIKPRIAAEMLGVSQWQLYRLVYERKIESRKLGRSVLIRTKDLINLLNLNPEDIETLIDFIGGRLAENQCSETLRNK